MEHLNELEKRGLILCVVLVPKPFLLSRAIYLLKFKNLKADLVYSSPDYWVFFQHKCFIPKLDELDSFNKEISNELICSEFTLDAEWMTLIKNDNNEDDYISLLLMINDT